MKDLGLFQNEKIGKEHLSEIKENNFQTSKHINSQTLIINERP